jgi:hypothetical protein
MGSASQISCSGGSLLVLHPWAASKQHEITPISVNHLPSALIVYSYTKPKQL